MYVVAHLNAMHQGRAAANGCRDMHCLGHLLDIRAFFEAGGTVGIDAIGALHGMSNSQRDERFLALRKRALREYGVIPIQELVP
jgi:hypothetical protein